MQDLNELDLLIIAIIEENKRFKVKEVGDLEMEFIHKLGIHELKFGMPIFYDKGPLVHFLETHNDKKKTRRLTPSETVEIIKHPRIILPNFSNGSPSSYLYVGELEAISISIVEVLIGENQMRVIHGGFEVKDPNYLKKAKELRNTILEGRQQI